MGRIRKVLSAASVLATGGLGAQFRWESSAEKEPAGTPGSLRSRTNCLPRCVADTVWHTLRDKPPVPEPRAG
jgi:hypothetical protein